MNNPHDWILLRALSGGPVRYSKLRLAAELQDGWALRLAEMRKLDLIKRSSNCNNAKILFSLTKAGRDRLELLEYRERYSVPKSA